MNENNIKEKNTISNRVYSILKNRIYNLEYKPGRSLSVATLAHELNVSRSPVREALLHLRQEELVQIFPQSGTRVSLINIHRMEEERFLRKSLELNALQEMFYDSNIFVIDEMEACIKRQKEIDFTNDLISFVDEDDNFHKQIFVSTNKIECWKLSKSFTPNEHRVRLLIDKSLMSDNFSLLQNHQDLVDAIRKRDLSKALEIDSKHLGKINYEIVSLMNNYPDLFESNTQNSKLQVPSNIRGIIAGNENFLDTVSRIY